MPRCYIFDLDGTLANGKQREHFLHKSPKDWEAYFADCGNDIPIAPTVRLLRDLYARTAIIIVSGRSASVKDQTVEWLATNDVPYNELHMRGADDRTDDDILKSEMLDEIMSRGWEPIMMFDDRNRVVKMWRKRGFVCAQVAEGDF